MAKPVTKTPRGREQRQVKGYTLGRLREEAKWPIRLPLEFRIFAKRLFYEKKKTTTRFKSSDCSAEAIHRSSWPIRYCLEKSNWTQTHTQAYPTTVTLQRMCAKG